MPKIRKEQHSDASVGIDEQVAAPAVITHLHVRDRETSTSAGAPRAWRKMTEIENAFMQERLGARGSNEARDRLEAGTIYARLWDTSQSRSKDSTEAFFVDGGGDGKNISEAQASAIRRLVAIEMHLGARDRIIIRCVCAFGNSPKEAMAQAKLCSDTRVSARLCEAMDALADAIDRTAKSRAR